MEITPEVKAQLEEQKKQCIFCKIISKEQEGKIVFEDDLTLAVLDIFPLSKGHTVFLTKEHYPIMPYIPANEFNHLFGLLPALSKSIQETMLTTGMNVFIANGGPAGQRAPHFLIHLIPRENGDGIFNFMFKEGQKPTQKEISMLKNNMPIMMQNHFGRNLANWHIGKGDTPKHLEEISTSQEVIYEDEKVICIIPENSTVPGHLVIYSKTEEKEFEKLPQEDASHIFFTASFAATAVFEGLGAHGTNIIVKSGKTEDNSSNHLSIHIIPRKQDDNLQQLMWEPKPPKYDLDQIAKKIKDKTWQVSYKEKKHQPKEIIIKPKVIKMSEKTTSKKLSAQDQIKKAIEQFK